MSRNSFYDEIIKTRIANLPNSEALERLGLLIDVAGDHEDVSGIDRALDWCNELEKRDLNEIQNMTLAYFKANAWGTLYRIRTATTDTSWRWEQPEIAEEIFSLRRALTNRAFLDLPALRRCQMLTNTANCLNSTGRFVEAIEIFSRALAVNPSFWEALGNRGAAFADYGKAHYDPVHSHALFVAAHDDLKRAVEIGARNEAENPSALHFFKHKYADLVDQLDIEAVRSTLKLEDHSLGRSRKEKHYRLWCLENCLFLNSINDIGKHEGGAVDILSQPTFTTKLEEPPSLIGLFNQLKQEFVSARFFYYEGIQDCGPHFSDRDVTLLDTLDYAVYGLNNERIKVAFRMVYSLFDKTAYFLYRYLHLEMKPTQVSFMSVWRGKRDEKAPLLGTFEDLHNWQLRGLYWLSKDIVDKEYRQTTEPDASELCEIRNQIEHKYLKTHSESIGVARTRADAIDRTDDLSYSIIDHDLRAKTLRTLKLARAALIYLSLGMHQEERRREAELSCRIKDEGSELYQLPVNLPHIQDKWKR